MSKGNGQNIKCDCGGDLDAVMDSRPRVHKTLGQVIYRRRKCANCGQRTSTIELPERAVDAMQTSMVKALMARLLEEFS